MTTEISSPMYDVPCELVYRQPSGYVVTLRTYHNESGYGFQRLVNGGECSAWWGCEDKWTPLKAFEDARHYEEKLLLEHAQKAATNQKTT